MSLPDTLRKWLRRRITGLVEPDSLLHHQPFAPSGQGYARERLCARETVRDPMRLPLPPVHLRMGYGEDEIYQSTGRTQVETMSRVLAGAGAPLDRASRVLDFGCSAGRLLRWLAPHTEHAEIWGVDLTAQQIFWCQENLSPPFHFALTTGMPHLPFEDRSFDLIYAGSVFTHIDDLAAAWLLELRRILRPGGHLYITLHDARSLELLAAPEYDDNWLAHLVRGCRWSRELAGGRLAMFSVCRDQARQVFYDLDHFRERISRWFEPVATEQEAFFYQTALLLRRPTE